MASNREGVNPLRPYYIPPTIGEPSEPLPTSSPNPFATRNATSGQYASKARDIFSDLDYKDYISEPSPSVIQTVKDFVDETLWKYTVVLLAQPFGVAKTVLQVRSQDDLGSLGLSPVTPEPLQRRTSNYGGSSHGFEYADSDSDADEPAYFTSNMPTTPTPSYPRNHSTRRVYSPLQSPRITKELPTPAHVLDLQRPDSTRVVIGQLWQKEGAWGVWKGSNATFLYTVLQSLLENWSRSCLSALFNVPDLGIKDDIDRLVDISSPYPWASLMVAAAAAVATGLILAPLDIVRTRLALFWN
jgi:mitochondrial fusion and transport protein UGO1